MIVLSGDIGGTSTRMQLTEFTTDNQIKNIKTCRYNNNEHHSFTAIIDDFLASINSDQTEIKSVCFGVAGPIVNEEVKFTNLPWVIKAADIRDRVRLDRVALINDFVAIGYGLETLQPQDLLTLQPGEYCDGGVRAYIGAGTGLGIGFMTCHHGGSYDAYPTEGGHIDFAPDNEIQIDLLKFLRKKHHRVSIERVLSGPGLVSIYRFVRANRLFGEKENPKLRFLIESDNKIDIAATISEYAVEHKDIMASRALDIFVSVYGSAVGNLALTTLPFGGLYIVGGIAPKLLSQIKSTVFLAAFSDKGRMSNLIKRVPLHVVLSPDVGLHGAAIYARKLSFQNI
jgi:glucokinase